PTAAKWGAKINPRLEEARFNGRVKQGIIPTWARRGTGRRIGGKTMGTGRNAAGGALGAEAPAARAGRESRAPKKPRLRISGAGSWDPERTMTSWRKQLARPAATCPPAFWAASVPPFSGNAAPVPSFTF